LAPYLFGRSLQHQLVSGVVVLHAEERSPHFAAIVKKQAPRLERAQYKGIHHQIEPHSR